MVFSGTPEGVKVSAALCVCVCARVLHPSRFRQGYGYRNDVIASWAAPARNTALITALYSRAL